MTLVIDTTSAAAKLPPATPVAVRVNGTTIAREAIVREMQHHPAEKPIAAWQAAARALAIRELLLQRARHLGLAPAPVSDAAGRRETDEEALIRALIEHEAVVPAPDAETCRRYYENNRGRFRSPDIYEAAHILFAAVAADRDGLCAGARRRRGGARRLAGAPRILRRAGARPIRAAHPRRRAAISASSRAGRPRRNSSARSSRWRPANSAPTPVATRYGFHVIRLDRKHDGKTLPYEAVAGRIADYLRDSVRRRADAQYIARLASAARIEGIELAGADALRVH